MAYLTGSASSFIDLKAAIESGCTANGWTLSNSILSKSGVFIKLVATSANIIISGGNGQSGSSLTDECPRTSKIFQPTHAAAIAIVFPVLYELFIYDNPIEVFCVINYNSDFYQNICFGKSNVASLPGSGNWFGASSAGGLSESNSRASFFTGGTSTTFLGSASSTTHTSYICGFPFFVAYSASSTYSNYYVHSNLDSKGWNYLPGADTTGDLLGPSYCASLINALPSPFNNSSPLIPIKALVCRDSYGQSIVAQLENMKHVRIDNLLPGEIITLGSDKWKIYPHFRKDSLNRKLGSESTTPAGSSGTLGVAIRFEGV